VGGALLFHGGLNVSTANDLIKSSLRVLGVIAQGETPSANLQSEGLEALNQLLESWSAQNLLIYHKALETQSLTTNQQSYTIGSGGDFDTTRPIAIEDPVLRQQGTPNNDFHMEIISQKEWSMLTVKDSTSSIPSKLWYQDNYPLGIINIWPKPSQANQLLFYSWVPLTEFSAGSDTVSLPPGYKRALKFNLAMELAPEYGVQMAPEAIEAARNSLANIKRINIEEHYLRVDRAALGGSGKRFFNWLTGE